MPIKKDIDLVICSKPLQWLNASNVDYDGRPRILIIISLFKDADVFYQNVSKYDDFWDRVLFTPSRSSSVKIGRSLKKEFNIVNLYIDCDYGKTGFNYTTLRPQKLFVYEEGFGPYVNKIGKSITDQFKKRVFQLLGWGGFLGGNKNTSGIYLHNPTYYKFLRPDYHGNVLRLKHDIFSFINQKKEVIKQVFGTPENLTKFKGKKVLLYLTAYNINPSVIKFIVENSNDFDQILIKIHPHLQNSIQDNLDIITIPQGKLTVISDNMLAEIYIDYLISNCKAMIIHENSSSCLYIDSSKVNVLNMGSVLNEEFERFGLYFQNDKYTNVEVS